MNPNPEIWGDSASWFYSTFAYGLTTDIAKIGNFDKPKVNNFGGSDNINKSALIRAIGQNKLVRNEYIDNTICPCGQAPDVSPFSKIAIFNEENDLSTTPRLYTIKDSNINWFFADRVRQSISNSSYSYNTTYYDETNIEYSLAYQQFAPKTRSDADLSNSVSMQLSPYVHYGIKSLLLSIEVCLMSPDAEAPSQSSWYTLDRWKNDFPTYSCVGMRLFVRNCLSYNNNQLTYNNDEGISEGQASYLCVTNPIPVTNNGEMTLTQFLTQYTTGFNARHAYIFNYSTTIYNYNDYRRNRAVLPCWDYFEGQTLNRYLQDSNTCIYYYKIPYNQANYDKMMSIAALFGCYFTPTNKYEFGVDMLNNDLYLTVLDENGVAHGQYTKGAENANNSLYSKNSIRDIDYNPDTPPTPVDPNTYSNTTVFNVIGAGASMNKRYLLDAANVAKLSTDLFDICDNMSTGDDYSFFDSKVKANMLTQSPIDSVVSLIRYPFTPTHGGTKQTVKLGRFEASAKGYPISNAIQTITFAGVDIFPRFGNNFLDYEPYTKYEVYVPFCDTVELSAADILGHTLNVRLVVDLFTGVCTGYILADSLCIETTSGNVGVSLPLTGLDTATINANIANAEANKKAAKKNYIKGHFDIITQKDKVGALWTQILGTNEDVVKKADYDLKHIETPMHTIGAASPLTSWAMDLNARVIIYYPTGDAITNNTPPELRDLTTYGHTTGFATIDNTALSNYSGFTVATNAILNFAATTTEKDMIESALNGGIFI